MKEWLLKFSKYNKKYYRFNHRQKKNTLKYFHATVREILFILTQMNSIY